MSAVRSNASSPSLLAKQHLLKMAKQQQHKQKHVPMRTCVVCCQKLDKRRLTRLVRTADAGVVIDPSGKRNGRGAYLCDNPVCWQNAAQKRTLEHALKTELTEAERQKIATFHPVSAETQAQHV